MGVYAAELRVQVKGFALAWDVKIFFLGLEELSIGKVYNLYQIAIGFKP